MRGRCSEALWPVPGAGRGPARPCPAWRGAGAASLSGLTAFKGGAAQLAPERRQLQSAASSAAVLLESARIPRSGAQDGSCGIGETHAARAALGCPWAAPCRSLYAWCACSGSAASAAGTSRGRCTLKCPTGACTTTSSPMGTTRRTTTPSGASCCSG